MLVLVLVLVLDLQSLELIPLSCLGNGRTTKVKCQVYSWSNFLKLPNSIKNKNNGCQSHASKGIAMSLLGNAVPRADTCVMSGIDSNIKSKNVKFIVAILQLFATFKLYK